MRRYLETLFRFKEVFLIPTVLISVSSLLLSLSSSGNQYRIETTIWVTTSPYVSSLDLGFGRRSANGVEAQALLERLSTRAFRFEVMDRMGLTEAIENGQWPVPSNMWVQLVGVPGLIEFPGVYAMLKMLNIPPPAGIGAAMSSGLSMIRTSIGVRAEGAHLLRIFYRGPEPALGARLIQEIVDLYDEKALEAQSEGVTQGLEFYTHQLEVSQEQLDKAGRAQEEFLDRNPAPTQNGLGRPLSEKAEISRLAGRYALANALRDSTLRRISQIQTSAEATLLNRDQMFQVIDPVAEPGSLIKPGKAKVKKRALLMAGMLGLVVGGGVGLVAIILLTWADNTVRTKDDIASVVDAALVAELPLVGVRRRKKRDLVRRTLAHGTILRR